MCEPDAEPEFSEPYDSSLQLLITVNENQHVKGGRRIVFQGARDNSTDTLHKTEEVFGEAADPRATNILKQLQNNRPFIKCAQRYGLGELECVRIIHEQIFAAIFTEGRTWRHSTILFISMKDHSLILHDLKFTDGVPGCVVFLPGEIWYAATSGCVHYHGPRANQELQPHSFKGDGRITRAFFSVVEGRAAEALEILKPMRLTTLNKIYIPKTTLTLFDVAADPDGSELKAKNIEFLIDDSTADAAILDTPLLPDAALLLDLEPLFAQGVYMMKRAIRAMDTEKIQALMKAGCPWISHDDVVDALPPRMEYEEAMNRLRPSGLRITFRY